MAIANLAFNTLSKTCFCWAGRVASGGRAGTAAASVAAVGWAALIAPTQHRLRTGAAATPTDQRILDQA